MEYTFYKIQVKNDCYIGSTKNYHKRMISHKCACFNDKHKHHNINVYKYIRYVGWDNIDIMIIDRIILNSKREAEKMEAKYMIMFDSKLNMVNSYVSQEDKKEYFKKYREDNREDLLSKKREYHHKNKEIILMKNKERASCDLCNLEMNKNSISRHKKKYCSIIYG